MKHLLKCYEILKSDIVRGENCYLYDKNNNKYVDFESGVWCSIVGHRNERINKIINRQIDKVTHLGYRFTNYLADETAVKIMETMQNYDGKCVFLSSGSEAVELSIKISKLVTGKKLLVTISNSYLGAYGDSGKLRKQDWIEIEYEVNQSVRIEKIDWKEVAAFVFEPGISSGRVKFPPEDLIESIEKKVRSKGGLIIIDEVTTGLGRTGKWYGYNHYKIKNDITAIGKGLGNGYPVSAVVIDSKIAKRLEELNFRYVQSHQNDPLGCVIAKEVITILKEDDLIHRSFKLGNYFLSCIEEIKNKFSFIKEVRGRGLMIAIEFENLPENYNTDFIFNEMLKRGFIIGSNSKFNVIRFMPPLTINNIEVKNLIKNLKEVLEELK